MKVSEIDPSPILFTLKILMEEIDPDSGSKVSRPSLLVGKEWRDGGSYPREAQPDYAVPDLAAAARITIGDDPVGAYVAPARLSNKAW